ncbi:ABC-F family ATP-binding cassette domain-containing protein [Actinoallomurus purpureus]|uniref:ABC-F family ATP-binding cassette domain-containing protein n=1 Tax=Actinoallomurus purpureus TaxID=478114 RepID=UPI0020928189|nr:ABC-F family ATP-binding cassette domain-containing protein [Actinoallomurus purpureus]MCO6006767.1 ABC-F family ATP-binding cassette domain-containing protein [Actinoallomurus purpureus]
MNLINVEGLGKAYGPVPLLDDVSLGVSAGDRIGVVGRNGGGKSTLVSLLAGRVAPDGGRVTHTRGLRLGFLTQRDEFPEGATVRSVVLGERAEHEWAGDARAREILAGLLPGISVDTPIEGMSGGERRRVALARLLVPETDLLVLDEPTNHLDIEAIAWLAGHLKDRTLIVVTHDRWFLDAVTERTWEVADGQVHRYEGGYSAYVLAKAERARIAASTEEKRQNLLRKELAWLRRGPQARSTKPKFRVDAANALIADEPPARDAVELVRFATSRLGKTVYDVEDVTVRVGDRTLFEHLTWQLGPGDRVGLVGVNGSGKSTLLRLLEGTVAPSAGRVIRGKTVQLAHLSQELGELDPARRVLESVEEIKRRISIGKREFSASQMLERFGFRGDAQWTPVGDLSGGERRRLQLLRLLMAEPNVLFLDEPTNDLDIEMLTELEDLLDGWPGSLVLVSHDRYFLERVSDRVLALVGDGRLLLLPGGVDEYLDRRRRSTPEPQPVRAAEPKPAKNSWQAKKELDRLERRIEKLGDREADVHELMATHATDHEKLLELDAELKAVRAEREEIEEQWLVLADEA